MDKYLDIPGWFNMHDAYMWCAKLAKDGEDIVEIGCFAGRGTRFLCDALVSMGKKSVKVHVIDTFEGSGEEHSTVNCSEMYGLFTKHLQDHIDSGMVQMNVNRSDNQQLINSFDDNSVAAVIVDGDHTYDAVADDVINWWPKVRQDGILVGDDVRWASVKEGSMKGFHHHGVQEVNILTGEEGWYAKVKTDKKDPHLLKMVPGMNCMKSNG